MTWFVFLRDTLAVMGRVAGGCGMDIGEQSTPAEWGGGTPVLTPRVRMCARLLCSGECRSGSLAPSAKPPVQPPRLSEKKADSEMCGLN